MATHSSVLAWRIPGIGELGGLPSMGLHRVGQDWNDLPAACSDKLLSSGLVVFNSVWSHELQPTRPPCPSLSPELCPSSFPLYWWWHPAISSSDALFSFCPQSSPALRTFPMSWLFASGDQNIGASASASVLPMEYSGLISPKIDWFDHT